MTASPYWQRFNQLDLGERLVFFRVTMAGREALNDYLKQSR